MFCRIKSQILSITINYKIPYWTSSANLRGPAEISSNLAIYTKMGNLRRRQKALQICEMAEIRRVATLRKDS